MPILTSDRTQPSGSPLRPLEISLALFARLEADAVRHCHWKSNEHLEEALAGDTDLDLLVDPDRARESQEALTGSGYKQVISEKWIRYPGLEHWYALDQATGKLSHVHLHYRLLSGRQYVKEQALPWEEVVLRSAVKHPEFEVFVTDPSLELLILHVRIAVKTKYRQLVMGVLGKPLLPRNIVEEMEYLLSIARRPSVENYARSLLGDELAMRFTEIVYDGDPGTLNGGLRLRSFVRRSLGQHRRYGPVRTTGRYLYYSLRLHPRLSAVRRLLHIETQNGKRLPHAGRIIALVGADGAGKTTLVSEIEKWLRGRIDVTTVYLGSGEGSQGFGPLFRRSMARLVGAYRKRYPRPNTLPESDDRSVSDTGKKGPLRSLYDLVIWFEYLSIARDSTKKVKRAESRRREGTVVVADRFPQSQATGIFDGPRMHASPQSSWLQRTMAKREAAFYEDVAEVRPELVVRLRVSLETAHQRKSDHPRAVLETRVNAVSDLSYPGSKVVDVDASRPLDEVLADVKAVVWEIL